MKKALGIFCILLVLLNLCGGYMGFWLNKVRIRNEVAANLQTVSVSKLAHFVLTEEEYMAVKVNEKEIRWEGEMYDVKKMKFDGSKLHIWAKHDKEETELLKVFVKMTKGQREEQPTPGKTTFSYLQLECAQWDNELTLSVNTTVRLLSIADVQSKQLVHLKVDSPPPDLLA